jgi:tetratricopeptide (TPR) repeat protein
MHDEKKWICLWFNAETQEKFMLDLEAFTDLMSEVRSENKSLGYRVQLIKKEFRLNVETSFLIVLDNLNESEWVERFLTNLSRNFLIIATSTKRSVLDKIAEELRVDYFDEEQAKLFFDRKFAKKRELSLVEKESLEKYFKYNQILPYDLNLLVNELNTNEFINLLELLDGYKDLCEKIFTDLYARVKEKSSTAWKLLQYLSFLDPEAMPCFLAFKMVNIDKFELEKVTKILKNNSLIQVIIKFGEKCFNIHGRTQNMIKRIINTMNDAENLEKSVYDVVLNEFDPNDEDYNKKQWNISKLLSRSILLGVESKCLRKDQYVNTCGKLGNFYMYIQVDYNQALKYFSKSLTTLNDLYGENGVNSALAVSLNNVASAYAKLGLCQKGLELNLKSLSMRKAIHGENENHPDIANSLSNVAEAYNDLGFYEQGLKFNLNSLKMNKALYGENENHPTIASSLNNIAQTYFELGCYEESLKFNLNSLKMNKALYGENENHPAIACSLSNIALTYGSLGLNQKSLEYHLKRD